MVNNPPHLFTFLKINWNPVDLFITQELGVRALLPVENLPLTLQRKEFTEKNSHMNGPAQFQSVLFKGLTVEENISPKTASSLSPQVATRKKKKHFRKIMQDQSTI